MLSTELEAPLHAKKRRLLDESAETASKRQAH